MKQLFSILLLIAITVTAYAEKNHKATAKSKAIKPKQKQPAQQMDTAKRVQYDVWERDARIGLSMHVAPISL